MLALRFGDPRRDGLSFRVGEATNDESQRPFESKEDDANQDKSYQSFDEDETAGRPHVADFHAPTIQPMADQDANPKHCTRTTSRRHGMPPTKHWYLDPASRVVDLHQQKNGDRWGRRSFV